MHVNYSISMPASNPLRISNQFGATTIPDYRGEIELSSKFGSLTTGALSNINTINVEFGKANFQSIANGTVTVKYSKAEFLKLVGNIKPTSDVSATYANFIRYSQETQMGP